jgi:hydrocephalus-inducing protein
VPAGGSAEYTLCYKPLTMTPSDAQPHEGSVFFPLPDGSGLLFVLHGQVGAACVHVGWSTTSRTTPDPVAPSVVASSTQADHPMPEAVIELSLPAKTQHTQTLNVSNWLHKPQRFK